MLIIRNNKYDFGKKLLLSMGAVVCAYVALINVSGENKKIDGDSQDKYRSFFKNIPTETAASNYLEKIPDIIISDAIDGYTPTYSDVLILTNEISKLEKNNTGRDAERIASYLAFKKDVSEWQKLDRDSTEAYKKICLTLYSKLIDQIRSLNASGDEALSLGGALIEATEPDNEIASQKIADLVEEMKKANHGEAGDPNDENSKHLISDDAGAGIMRNRASVYLLWQISSPARRDPSELGRALIEADKQYQESTTQALSFEGEKNGEIASETQP